MALCACFLDYRWAVYPSTLCPQKSALARAKMNGQQEAQMQPIGNSHSVYHNI